MILTVLKMIGIVLLIILGLLIFILGLLLFVPIRYRFASSFYSGFQADASVKWMPLMLNAAIFYENQEVKYVIKLFGRVIITNTDKKLSWLGRKFFAFDDEKEIVTDDPEMEYSKKSVIPIEDKNDFEKVSYTDVTGINESRRSNTNRKKEKKSNNKSLRERIHNKFNVIIKKIRVFINQIKGINKKKEDLLRVYHSKRFEMAKKDVIDYGKKILSIVKPDGLEGFVHFGLEDPADTGQILGVIGMALPLYDEFLIIQPDFEQACLEGNINGNGKIRLFPILKLALKVIFNKNLIKVTKKVQTIIEA